MTKLVRSKFPFGLLAIVAVCSPACAQVVMSYDAPAAEFTNDVTVSCKSIAFAMTSDATGQTVVRLNGSVLSGADAQIVREFVSEQAASVRSSFRCHRDEFIIASLTRASSDGQGKISYDKITFKVSQSNLEVIEQIEVTAEDFFYR